MSGHGGIILKTPQEIEKMKELGRILAEIVDNLYELADEGLSPVILEERALDLCREFEVNASCKGYQGYPAATCIGINDQSVHNAPSRQVFKIGDIVTIDMVIDKDGWFVDHARTKIIGQTDKRGEELTQIAKEALDRSVKQVKVGSTIGDIGETIESTAQSAGFSVLKNFVGHGIGKSIHEDPKVPCFGQKGKGEKLGKGMVFTIEPMIAEFGSQISMGKDGWSTKLKDGGRFAMFEHTVALSENGVEILTKK
ncbi:type I methionyl aminopeptidase [Candidatus Dojkabacteria bacterium]|nr:type I methionyl aminopeptidase [Candidatus Dojkabacteria bacterium]